MKTVKQKAWAVIVFNDFISNLNAQGGVRGRAIFFEVLEAKKFLRNYKAGDLKNLHEAKIVPITITYKIK